MMRKSTAQSRGPNAAEKAHMAWVKHNGDFCSACQWPAILIVHHCEGATFRHNKILIGHWFVLGLCQECDDVVTHGSRRAFREKFGPQSELWLRQFERYPFKTECTLEVQAAIKDWGK